MPAMQIIQIISRIHTDTHICGLKSVFFWNSSGCLHSSKVSLLSRVLFLGSVNWISE